MIFIPRTASQPPSETCRARNEVRESAGRAGCGWRARRVAHATRRLGLNAAMHVDSAVAHAIVSLPWHRFETLLQAKIIEADPKAAEEQAEVVLLMAPGG